MAASSGGTTATSKPRVRRKPSAAAASTPVVTAAEKAPAETIEAAAPALPPAAEPIAQAAEPAVETPPVETQTAVPPSAPPTSMEIPMAASSFNGYEEFASFGKANLDAFIQANTVLVKGIEEISKEMFGQTQATLESAAAATTAMLSAKTLKDVVELNADFTKTQYEKMIANTTKLSEMGAKLATDAAAPIAARANHMVATVTHASV